jgi:hypothetical protein
MKESPQKSGTHTAKHRRKASTLEVDGFQAMIRFSPAALEAMQELHALALAHGHEHFDGDVADILKDMAYGKPLPVSQALSLLATVSAEAGVCSEKTGDSKVRDALSVVEKTLNGMNDAHPTTVTIEPKAKGR